MRIGVSFPQSEIGADTDGIRAYAQAIEDLGYTHVTCGEHIVGVDTKRPGFVPRQGMPKDLRDIAYPYQEPLTFFAFLAGLTKRIELLSSVLILPQRQTVVVAKQAAQVDNASGGRLRIGIGSGWSEYEYESLGMDFHTRGRRMEEQVTILRGPLDAEDRHLQDALAHDGGNRHQPAPDATPHPDLVWRRRERAPAA